MLEVPLGSRARVSEGEGSAVEVAMLPCATFQLSNAGAEDGHLRHPSKAVAEGGRRRRRAKQVEARAPYKGKQAKGETDGSKGTLQCLGVAAPADNKIAAERALEPPRAAPRLLFIY